MSGTHRNSISHVCNFENRIYRNSLAFILHKKNKKISLLWNVIPFNEKLKICIQCGSLLECCWCHKFMCCHHTREAILTGDNEGDNLFLFCFSKWNGTLRNFIEKNLFAFLIIFFFCNNVIKFRIKYFIKNKTKLLI